MRLPFRYAIVALVALLPLPGASCGSDPSAPFGATVPTGKWRLDTLGAGGEERHVMVIDIASSTNGRIHDTLFVDSSGSWAARRVVEQRLRISSLGDGYHRVVESTMSDSTTVIDSIPRYWYFITRADTTRFYRGMRFTGGNVGLVGAWRLDRPDSLLLNGYLDLVITGDTIRVDNASSIPVPTGHYHYLLDGSALMIDNVTFGFGGDRYEVVPGASLYITGYLSERFVRVR